MKTLIEILLKDRDMIEWLRKNKQFLSIRAIEQHLEMPDSTLIKAVNGVQKLPKKYNDRLKSFINNLI